MLSQVCAACGKAVTESALQDGSAVLHGGRAYCATCAALIVTPGSVPAIQGEDVEVLEEYKISFNAPDVVSPFAAKPSGTVVLPGNSGSAVPPPGAVVEGEDVDMPMNSNDDDWFKPKGNTGGAAVKEASNPRLAPAAPQIPAPAPKAAAPVKPAAKASGVSSRVGIAPAKKAGSTSARLAAAPTMEMPTVEPPAKAARPASVRASAAGPVAPATKGGSSRRMIPVAKSAPVPVEPPQMEAQVEGETEEAVEEEHEVVAPGSNKLGRKSSRRMSSRGSARSSASRSAREDRDEKESKKDKRKGGKEKDNTPIYIGVGVVALLLIGAFMMTRGPKEDDVAKKAPQAEAVDKTPSGDYARQGEAALKSGNKSSARDFYSRAATQAEREGNGTQARNYSMKAMDIIKSSKLHDR